MSGSDRGRIAQWIASSLPQGEADAAPARRVPAERPADRTVAAPTARHLEAALP